MSKPPFDPPASYEAAMEELEQLTGLIESGQLPLEQLLAGYERGAQLLKFCRDKLQAVEEQIKVLDAGVLTPEPADGAARFPLATSDEDVAETLDAARFSIRRAA